MSGKRAPFPPPRPRGGMAAWYAVQGMTLFDALEALYRKYGFYGEKTHNLVMPGLDGLEKMAALMKSLRAAPPTHIAGVEVLRRKDYTDGSVIDCRTGEKDCYGTLRQQCAAV